MKDLAYGQGSAARKLDLYLPKRSGAAVPLVVLIHGGAFAVGDKGDLKRVADALVGRGYAVASVNYRLSGEARFPAGAQDVKGAVRWLRANAATYGLNPQQFAAWGESAGGYMAAMLGTTGDQKTVFDTPAGDRSLTPTTVSSAVQVVVDWYGPTDFATMDSQVKAPGGCPGGAQVHAAADSPESRWIGVPIGQAVSTVRAASPVTYVAKAKTLPQFVIVHGSADCLVSKGQSEQLAASLKKKGAKVDLTILNGAGHGGGQFESRIGSTIDTLDRIFGRD